MTFDAWLKKIGPKRGVTAASVAELLGVHIATVCRWRRHECIPNRSKVLKIQEYTEGKVTPRDWYATPKRAARKIVRSNDRVAA